MNSCCVKAGPPDVKEYALNGSFSDVNGLSVYKVGDGTRCLIVIPDIFGRQSARIEKGTDATDRN